MLLYSGRSLLVGKVGCGVAALRAAVGDTTTLALLAVPRDAPLKGAVFGGAAGSWGEGAALMTKLSLQRCAGEGVQSARLDCYWKYC